MVLQLSVVDVTLCTSSLHLASFTVSYYGLQHLQHQCSLRARIATAGPGQAAQTRTVSMSTPGDAAARKRVPVFRFLECAEAKEACALTIRGGCVCVLSSPKRPRLPQAQACQSSTSHVCSVYGCKINMLVLAGLSD